jgi:outer membrane protein TolC
LEHEKDKAVRELWKAYNDTKVTMAKQQAAGALLAASEKASGVTFESYRHGLATFPDVRESQRDLARARKLGQAARAEVVA